MSISMSPPLLSSTRLWAYVSIYGHISASPYMGIYQHVHQHVSSSPLLYETMGICLHIWAYQHLHIWAYISMSISMSPPLLSSTRLWAYVSIYGHISACPSACLLSSPLLSSTRLWAHVSSPLLSSPLLYETRGKAGAHIYMGICLTSSACPSTHIISICLTSSAWHMSDIISMSISMSIYGHIVHHTSSACPYMGIC